MWADARLDNSSTLKRTLGLSEEASIQETLAEAYSRWDASCAARLLGDFAFVVWDQRRRRVYCARDPFGVRTLYYQLSDQRLLFATCPTGLLALIGEHPGYDEPYIANFLQQFGYDRLERTFLRGCLKLKPGHSLEVTDSRAEIRRYWRPEEVSPLDLRRDEDYFQGLRSLIEDSVSARLVGSGKVGTHLSGGLDCSTITVLANRFMRERGGEVHPFSWSRPIGVDETLNPLDERLRLQGVLEQEELACDYINVTVRERLSDTFADPATDPHFDLLHEQVVQRRAQSRGVDTILTGWGGDEAASFASRGFFVEQFLKLNWPLLFRELGHRACEYRTDIFSMFRHRVLVPLLPGLVYRRIKPSREGPTFINPEFAEAMKGKWHFRPRHGLREGLTVRGMMLTLLQHGHLTERIESWCISGKKKGLTYAYPLLDKRVVEFALGCPSRLFFHQGEERYLYRQAVRSLLPESVLGGVPKWEGAVFDRLPVVEPRLTAHIWKPNVYVDTWAAKKSIYEKSSPGPGKALLIRALKVLRLGGAGPNSSSE